MYYIIEIRLNSPKIILKLSKSHVTINLSFYSYSITIGSSTQFIVRTREKPNLAEKVGGVNCQWELWRHENVFRSHMNQVRITESIG